MPRSQSAEGRARPLYLTNACCEVVDDGVEAILRDAGIVYGEGEDEFFYPLTKDEERYIGHEVALLADGVEALLGYSALFEGEKYLMPSIEIVFDPEDAPSKEDALARAQSIVGELRERVEAVGGHVLLDEENEADRHLVQVLLPFDYARASAGNFGEWVDHLEGDLLAIEAAFSERQQPSPTP